MIRLRNFQQKSLNMVKTPKLKFLDTSTCELFQLDVTVVNTNFLHHITSLCRAILC